MYVNYFSVTLEKNGEIQGNSMWMEVYVLVSPQHHHHGVDGETDNKMFNKDMIKVKNYWVPILFLTPYSNLMGEVEVLSQFSDEEMKCAEMLISLPKLTELMSCRAKPG